MDSFIFLMLLLFIWMVKEWRNGQKASVVMAFFFFILPIFLSMAPYIFEEANWNPLDYARITDVDYKAVVVDEPDNGGKVIITERLTYDIRAASKDNLFWELYRDLPEDYVDGLKVEYKVNSVKQILEDGTNIVYEESPKLYWEDEDYVDTAGGYGPGKWYHSEGPYNEYRRQYECVLFYVDGLYREEVVFEIEYEMSNAALRYNDCSELYLCMYSEDTVKYLESFNGQILFPDKDMPSEGNYDAYTYGTNTNSFPFTESDTLNPGYHTFMFNLDESSLKFRPHNEYIEFALVSHGADKHIFTENAPDNRYSNDDVLWELEAEQKEYEDTYKGYSNLKFVVLLICLGGTFVVIRYSFKKEKKIKAQHVFYEPTMQMEYFRDIPSDLDPTFASALVFCKNKPPKDKGDGYAAIMLSLVRKGYIELVRIDEQKDWKFNNVKIVVKYETDIKKLLDEATTLYNILLNQEPLNFEESLPTENTVAYLGTDNNDFSPIQQALQDSLNGDNSEYNSENPLDEYHQNLRETILEKRNNQLKELEEKISAYKQELDKFEPLTLSEEYYFNLIVYHTIGTEISLPKFQSKVSTFYATTDTFVKNVENSIVTIGIEKEYFQKANYQEPKKQLQQKVSSFKKWGIIFLVIVNLISYFTRLDLAFGGFTILGAAFLFGAIYLNKVSRKYVLLTQFGEDEYVKWRGLYNFLNSETLMNERTVIELPIWEKYLIYATAFGISEKVIKALNIRCPEMDMSPILSNSYYRSSSFRSSSRSFRSTTRRASYTARGGGSGGSWRIRWRRPRRRWRPEAVTKT